jgi:P pilus assembly chaperone PapD
LPLEYGYYIPMRKALYPVALFSALFIFHPSKVIPADFTVSPVRLFLGAGQKASIIKVKNNSDEKLTLQLTVNSWEQDIDGESRYLPRPSSSRSIHGSRILTAKAGICLLKR